MDIGRLIVENHESGVECELPEIVSFRSWTAKVGLVLHGLG